MDDITGDGTAVTGLGGAAGYGEVEVPRGDDSVAQVDVAAVFESGFTLGGVHYAADALFIATDGLISFGAAVPGVAADANAIAAPFFAIFNGDVDTRLDGEGAESGGVWLDVDTVQDCVTITWDHVGFYRRNATLTDTFQIQLFDRGNGGFDVVFRYQDIAWTSGDLQGGWGGLGGLAPLIGYRATANGAATLLGASGNEAAALALETSLGNSGVAGLWVWSFAAPSLILGTAQADTLRGTTGNDTMQGLGGSDVLLGSRRADVLDGGSGSDRADYGTAPASVTIDLADLGAGRGFAAGDSYVLIEAYAGSDFADTLLGGAAGDCFYGGGGADRVTGRAGADRLYGGAGNDLLNGSTGFDRLFGDSGDDLVQGRGGRDRLFGGSGNDVLKAGSQDDTLDGGPGSDTLAGGTGADDFRHGGTGGTGTDWIMDFDNAGGDRLVFGIEGAVKADFSVTFVTVAGAGRAGVAEAHVTYLPDNRLVWIVVDGAAEAMLMLQSSMNSFDLL